VRVEQQPAYVLHARPYRETSLLLEVFTRDHGRVGIIARGIRRERSRLSRGMLQPLQPLLLDWTSRGDLGTLTGADVVRPPFPLAGDALLAAMCVNELVLRLTGRGDTHAPAFDAYAICLGRLSEGASVAWTLRRFERDLLAELGYALVLDRCADGSPLAEGVDYTYDPEAGPVPARGFAQQVVVSARTLAALGADALPDPVTLGHLRRMMREVLRHHLGGDLRSWALASRAARVTQSSG
jgi:DNA repair protein RecO (recombination protein O)